ncbi:MAG: aminotransferase class V-fold PLP-dependent enzyme [Gammaproteobacteria bacterium]|nr:aminotransferase class V-fold PLP-dependent enzyme [Gammaproteobacteria bacterium]
MSLNFGRTQLAIPGPSVIPDRVLAAMHRPSPNIYTGELIEITETLYPDLKRVARTKSDVAIYIANGHGAWEASLRNTLSAGDKILVLATGSFGLGWGELAESLGIDVQLLDFGFQSDADPDQVEEVLRSDIDCKIKAVLTVQTDTASSVINDIPGLRKAIDNAGHNCLFMVDCIASLGCDRFEMDDWGVDVMVTASQKGLMTPAGISFVFFNDKAAEARKSAAPGQYWDWLPRTQPAVYYQKFAGTAPTQHIFALREALDILVHEEGIERAWARHKTIAYAVWAAVDAWGKNGVMQHNIADQAKRSHAVSAISTNDDHAGQIREWCEFEAGITLGIGLGLATQNTPEWNQYFRIGHMGHQNVAMTMAVLGAIDTAMKARGIAHGDGALEAATNILSKHPAG